MCNYPTPKKIQGFTLLEMITVITILGFISIAGINIVITLIKAQNQVYRQSNVLMDGQLATIRITKQLRSALPNSLRISNQNRCLTFLPVVASTYYLDELPDEINGNPPIGRSSPIAVYPFVLRGNPVYMSVGASSTNELYGNNVSSLVSLRDVSVSSIGLQYNHRWERNSPNEQLFLTASPEAFCLVDSELRFYDAVAQTANQVDLSQAYELLLLGVETSTQAFSVDSNVSGCLQCVEIDLRFVEGDVQFLKNTRFFLSYGQ